MKLQDKPLLKNISSILTKMAKEYSPMINATVDHIDDTLVFLCPDTTRFYPNGDTFKLRYVDSIASGIGKNVYLLLAIIPLIICLYRMAP